MLVIVIAILVSVEILVLLIGTAIPNSRLTAQVKLEEEMKINVGPVQFSNHAENHPIFLFSSFRVKALIKPSTSYLVITKRQMCGFQFCLCTRDFYSWLQSLWHSQPGKSKSKPLMTLKKLV